MFERHMINSKGVEEIDSFKSEFAQLTEHMMNKMGDGRAKSIFFTKIEEAMFFGTKAIAEKPTNHESVTTYGNQAD